VHLGVPKDGAPLVLPVDYAVRTGQMSSFGSARDRSTRWMLGSWHFRWTG
jgi:hypothetical protein